MAELQKTTPAGENAARFIEFVMMQAQNASLFLGLIPNPQSGQPEVNLDLARLFIDQLTMIQEKTRGNLTTEETNVLRNALTNLQMAYFEVSQGKPSSFGTSRDPVEPPLEEDPAREDGQLPEAAPASVTAPVADTAPEPAPESRKRFTKSYGS